MEMSFNTSDDAEGVPSTSMRPIRDMGSFVHSNVPSDADIKDHRSQNTVYIGLHLPSKTNRRGRHRHRRGRRESKQTQIQEANKELFNQTDVTSPAQRVQFLLEDQDEEDEEHRTHDVFCEMQELFSKDSGDLEWKETARWVKFEEDVEEGGERWSKPHVATLSLHSLFELRCNILQGTVILDMDANSLSQIVDIMLDRMVAGKQLEDMRQEEVRDVLLLRHRHANEKKHTEHNGSKYHLPIIRSLADIGKKYSEPRGLHHHSHAPHSEEIEGHLAPSNLQPKPDDVLPGAKSTPNFQLQHRDNHSDPKLLEHHATHSGALTANDSTDLLESATSSTHKLNMHFMKKIPKNAEAANILVGEVDFLNHPIVSFIRLLHPQLIGDMTEVPVPTKFIFVLLGPKGNQNKFHEIGRSIATLMSDEVFHDVAYHAKSTDDLLAGIDEFLDQVTVLPPGEWDPSIRIEPPKSVPSQESRKTPGNNPPMPNGKVPAEDDEADGHTADDPCLQRTGRLFGGMIDDIKRKAPFYKSDITDAFHVQALASFVFLYFACLTPIITFGGLLGDATKNNMAAFESLLAGAICGIVYALCAGQPLTILGSTGPVLVFETITFQFCDDNGLDYLQMRFWIGLWTGVILIIMTAFDLSALVRFITRFTEESFALLISLIFIKEAFAKLFSIASKRPINFHPDIIQSTECYCKPVDNVTLVNLTVYPDYLDTNWSIIPRDNCTKMGGLLGGEGCYPVKYYGDVFFISVLLFLGTFCITYALKSMRNSSFFPNFVRSILSDFAVLIAIVSMVGLDAGLGLDTPKLEVPENFAPTNPLREWVVNPVSDKNPWWCAIAAIIPALLATILIFMDQQITAVIVNRKENKLKKSKGYHLDLLIVAVLIIINSLLGLPWFVAATVLSINHVMSLKKESECTAPGERPKFLGVREQRVTGFTIFLMIGLSVLLTKFLRAIPMAVLYGVFLYMGVGSLNGMQVVDRILLIFMPQKYQPDYMYLRHVRTRRVHLFTFIQVMCLVILWVVKTIKEISIAFPIMVLAMCFVRKGMDWFFTQTELQWLDDIMPEYHTRAKEDQMKKEEESAKDQDTPLLDDHIDMNQIISVGVDSNTVGHELDAVNISQEMAKTAMWKTIVANESSSNLQEAPNTGLHQTSSGKKKHRHSDRDHNSSGHHHHHHHHSKHKKNKKPVQFYIDDELEEEKEDLICKPPEIVVDPPSYSEISKRGSGSDESKC